jgi:hypothetical protein
MDLDVFYDPDYQALIQQFNKYHRELLDAVIAQRSWHLKNFVSPDEETNQQRMRAALLANATSEKFEALDRVTRDLVRYGYELAPFSNNPKHLAEVAAAIEAQHLRLAQRKGEGRGPGMKNVVEEKARVDDGPPITLLIDQDAYASAVRRKSRLRGAKPAKRRVTPLTPSVSPLDMPERPEPEDDSDEMGPARRR